MSFVIFKRRTRESYSLRCFMMAGSPLRYLAVFAALAMVLPGMALAQTLTAALTGIPWASAIAVNPVTNKIYVAEYFGVTLIDGVTNSTVTVTLAEGLNSVALAVNPVTNKIYVANEDSNNVTVIDGATNSTATVATGRWPFSVAVNPVTNKIYVANYYGASVTVIDGATNSTTTIAAGSYPMSVAVNPVTNKIYVANNGSASVTVIDGATNSTTTITAGSNPMSVAVNPVTNKIYVANDGSANVTVIDGATNNTTTITAGSNPTSVAVNPVTNVIYVTNAASDNVTVINGASNSVTATVAVGGSPGSVVVNPMTNTIYVTNGYAVTVLDGASNSATTFQSSQMIGGLSAAVNPVTNKIYFGGDTDGVSVIDGATNTPNTVTVGADPSWVAVNPVTNKIYIPNRNGASVTVINGTDNVTTTVAAGTGPVAAAVNPLTDKIYVANSLSANVTVIDGITNGTTTVGAGMTPIAVAVDPLSDKIYVANSGSGNVTVIDGVTNKTISVAVGAQPESIAVNPVTNKIYVANAAGNSVTVIDGVSLATTTIAVGKMPWSVAVNSVTNKIYVALFNSTGDATVIDGATNSTTEVSSAVGYSISVAVNEVTNQIYVLSVGEDFDNGALTLIDGATNTTTTVLFYLTLPEFTAWRESLAVNPVTNKIYVASGDSGYIAIDGATLTRLRQNTYNPTSPYSVAVNPATNKVYFANANINSVTVLDEQQVQPVPLTTNITPLPNNEADNSSPTFSFTAQSSTVTTPGNVFFQVDTWENAWSTATGLNPSYTGRVASSLQPGFHILYAYAGDGQEASSTEVGSPLTGAIQAYGFLVTKPSSASFGGLDTTTQGTWTDKYGANGYFIANDVTKPPSYATVSLSGDNPYSWTNYPAGTRALQRATDSSWRIASTYFAPNSFSIDVSMADGNSHRIALYLLDWDNDSRVDTISFFDAQSNALLDTETFSGFQNGEYAYWNVQGHVRIQVTRTGGGNAVVSGIFFDTAPTSSATYAGTDTATQGTWTGTYGTKGDLIASDVTNSPAYAIVSLTGDKPTSWDASTSDVRALQTASDSSTRIASTYFAPTSFTIDVNLSDGNAHKISLYLLDWDSTSREESISIVDVNSNTVLDTETYSNFHNGEYASWNIQGHVQIQVRRTGGSNAVVSGVFFDN